MDQLLMLSVVEVYLLPFIVAVISWVYHLFFTTFGFYDTVAPIVGLETPGSYANMGLVWLNGDSWLAFTINWLWFLMPMVIIFFGQQFFFDEMPNWRGWMH